MNPASRWRTFLWPLGVFYGAGARARVWLYGKGLLRQRRLPQIVVSVGNLTVGGTGKTPMVLWLAERLAAEGKRVAILTRGYKGSGNRNDSAGSSMGDEAQLLAQRARGVAQVVVGADRYREALRIEQKNIEWFVLDDGFQHLRLARDTNLVLIDALDPFGGGLLPAGSRREPLSALARADILVITRTAGAPAVEEQLRLYTRAPVFYAQTQLESILPVPGALPAAAPLPAPGARKFFAFCGIGNAAGFWKDLSERWGFQLAGTKAFRDHHAYSTSDLRKIEREALAAGAEALVCTEKDVYNLPSEEFEKLPAYYCRIGWQLNDPENFWRAILAAVERRRAGGAP
jgi:tetraacyldisaccharide 4'-kinase